MLCELLIAAGPREWRAVLLEDGVPVELFVERGNRSEAGSIFLGRVRRLVPALDAVLVDIGGDRLAFLPASEILPRGRRLDEGERLVVQIRREAQGGKTAQLTTGVVLRGALVELRLERPGILGGATLSPAERAQLLATLTHPAPWAGSPLSRTAGDGAEAGEDAAGLRLLAPEPIDSLIAEATDLKRRWRDILDRANKLQPPAAWQDFACGQKGRPVAADIDQHRVECLHQPAHAAEMDAACLASVAAFDKEFDRNAVLEQRSAPLARTGGDQQLAGQCGR